MLALQLEAAVARVIEAHALLEARRPVAASAVGLPLRRELARVHVGVAAGAGERERPVADLSARRPAGGRSRRPPSGACPRA